MQPNRLFLLAAAALLGAPAFAQSEAQCIVAGRVSDAQWAPRLAGVQLLGSDGRPVAGASRQALAGVKQARLAQPALLSRCDGDAPLFNADNEAAGRKTEVPALSAGVVQVEGVAFPRLRTGGELVELRVRVPAERVVLLAR
ncbi:MAG TPA: hypothetical protein VNB23_01075 [Ramlibacter sp.]|nr:hypothetical protein [Ramlibacter sp.]